DSVQTNTSSSTARRSIIAPIINTYQTQSSIVSTPQQQQQQQQQPQVDKVSNHSTSMTSPMGQSPERLLRPTNEKYDF
ncbi:unnamed protein product, partial [Rotaria magnacalcarata]